MKGKIFYPEQEIEKAYQKIAAKKELSVPNSFMSLWELEDSERGIASLTHY